MTSATVLQELGQYRPHGGTCSGLIESRRITRGDSEAIVFEDRVWTWNQVHDAVERIACYFQNLGVNCGDRVAIIATNSDFYAMAFLAVARLGAATVTINCELTAAEIKSQIERVRPKLVLASWDRAEKLSGIEFILLEGPSAEHADLWALSDGARADLPPLPKPDDPCLIMFTSGTTGSAKGVVHANRNFVLSGEGFVGRMALSPEERLICVLPLFHINALFYSFAGALAAGATVIFERRFSASKFWTKVSSSRATQVNLIAAAGNILLRRDRSEFVSKHKLSKVYLSPLTSTLHDGFRSEFGVDCLREGYGLTEAPGVINQPVDEPPRLGSMGRVSRHPLDGSPLAEMRIVTPSGGDAEVDEAGELWIKSPLLMQGYFEDPASTRSVLQDGWFRTGDLVKRNDLGEFFFIERIKDIIRRRGENISGAALDAVISGHPHVAQVAVLATPSEFGEDEILAALVPSQPFSAQSFRDWCCAVLPPHQRPKFIVFCKDLPRTPSEKIQKYKIRRDPLLLKSAIDLSKI